MQQLFRLPDIKPYNGSLEALKWVGLIFMSMDHINKYLYNNSLSVLFEVGRLSLPIFLFVIACKLSQSDIASCNRTIKRIFIFGSLAIPFYVVLGQDHLLAGWWPLNVMFTLLVVVIAIGLIRRGQRLLAVTVVMVGGGLVEFWWPAVIFGLACYYYCQQPSWKAVALATIGCLFLSSINGNFWVFASIPLIFLLSIKDITFPRFKWFFYGYYPLHLAAIWRINIIFYTG